MTIDIENLDPNYVPTEGEPFMDDKQLAFFKMRLIQWRDQLIHEGKETISNLQNHTTSADEIDLACQEINYALELRARDRDRKLINKIKAALERIEDGSYGYCEETGDPIGIKRLIARPIATLSIEAQERHERKERTHSEAA